MRCPTLTQLPPPPPGTAGWPWTEERAHLPDAMPDVLRGPGVRGRPWPRITIVTPSYNQGRFIEETIRSVLLQGYPNLEYILIDGGSTDDSLPIIHRYSPWLAFWVSEPDLGQSDALNKGFARSTGDIHAYINSDDVYEPGAFEAVALALAGEEKYALIAGECIVFAEAAVRRVFRPDWPDSLAHLLEPFGSPFAQPSSFWTRLAHSEAGEFDPHLHYVFDREFFLRLGLLGLSPRCLPLPLARYREHAATKTNQTIKFYQESIPLIERYASRCGLDPRRAAALRRDCQEEIRYLETFTRWKRSGRLAALRHFLAAAVRFPRMLRKRRVLGLARRLLFFPAASVAELENV